MKQKTKTYLKNNFGFMLPFYRHLKSKREYVVIENFYKTNFDRNVLIAYITNPFISGVHFSQSNTAESLAMASRFKELGYNVDVVPHNYSKRIDYKKYDIVFGFGAAFSGSFYRTNENQSRIYYGTGMHPYYSNVRTLERIKNVHIKTGVLMPESGRIVSEDYLPQTTLADGLIILGNDITRATYAKFFNGPIKTIPVSYFKLYDYKEVVKNKNFNNARKHFLFFSGSGMIHKGLDLLLDVFKEMPNIDLHICGSVEGEKRFANTYRDELANFKNIYTYGYTRYDSDNFLQLLKQCAFFISPSCSEGMNTSMVNAIGNGGLIPIATKQNGIDMTDLSVEIRDADVESVRRAIAQALAISGAELKEGSMAWGEKINRVNSLDNFAEQFKKAITSLINK